MVKQCPRCWEKVNPEDRICPSCGYDFVNKPVPAAKKVRVDDEAPSEKKHVVFPKAKKKEEDDTTFLYKLSFALALIWAILAVLGGIANLADGEYLRGAGFVASGVVSALAFMLIRSRERNMIACLLIIVSGAATLHIPLLIVSVLASLTVYFSGTCYKSR